MAPRLFKRRAELVNLGRVARRTGGRLLRAGAGPGLRLSSLSYGFEESRGSALLTMWPTRRLLMLRGGFELSRWDLKSGSGRYRSSTPLHARHLGWYWPDDHVRAYAGDGRPRLPQMVRRDRRRATRAAAGSTVSPATTSPTGTPLRLSTGRLRGRAARTICARPGSFRCAAGGNHLGEDEQQVPFYLLPSLGGGAACAAFRAGASAAATASCSKASGGSS